MSVMSVRINDEKRKVLKIIASIEGKTISGIVSSLIEQYVDENKNKLKKIAEKEHLDEIMKLSEPSFMEWDNKEDEIYDKL